MSAHVNPGNDGFARILKQEYVDKTGIIALVNEVVGTARCMVAVTRPRRFGKSFAAESIVAYYSCGCDSRSLFEGLEISRAPGYADNLNRYNLVRLDMTEFHAVADIVAEVSRVLLAELRELVPDAGKRNEGEANELTSALLDVVQHTGRRFVFVVDEWDAPLREPGRAESGQREWINLLRVLFKNASFTGAAIDAAYLTGILPIKRYGTQSALTDFREYTMLEPDQYAEFVGFTEAEVGTLAAKHRIGLDELRTWYDGYDLPHVGHVFAPFSVMEACKRERCGSFWVSSEAFESLRFYIDMDFDGLQQDIIRLLGSAEVEIDTGSFDNDVRDVRSADDVLTLLAHLGYLAYRGKAGGVGTVRVPNEEVRFELRRAVRNSSHEETARIVRESDALLRATWNLDSSAVADAVSHAHDAGSSPLYYNDEQALRAVVRAAYISALDSYSVIEEFPGGHGFADLAFLPKRRSSAPAMLIELKWDKSPEAAIAQVRERNYPQPLRAWEGPILLVGITYDSQTKEHRCIIEEA